VRTANVPSTDASRPLTARQIYEFANKARWEVRCDDPRAHRSRCLDGRYKPGAGIIAMPGADAGLLAIGLLGAQWTTRMHGQAIEPHELCELVLDVVGGKQNFSYHTDRVALAGDEHRYDGCSYCRLLATSPELFAPYALQPLQLVILQEMLGLLEQDHVKPDILRGGHDECAVLVAQNVRSLSRGEPLSSDDIRRARKLWVLDNYAVLRGTGRRRAFVYQRDLAQSRIDALAEALAQTLRLGGQESNALRGMLEDIAELHVRRTLEHLAPGLPVYDIFIDVDSGEVGEPERRR
jgi:hypothetical protein